MIAMLPCWRTKDEHFGGKFDNPCALFSRIYFVSTFPSMLYSSFLDKNRRVTRWSQREFAFCLDINYAYIRTWRGRHLKETDLWDNITWSEIIRHLLISNNNTPFLPPNILHKHCLGFLLGPQLFLVSSRNAAPNKTSWRGALRDDT